jgi:hypothetical protein
MARTSSLGGFIKQLDREQATPQARTSVYCLINMMLGKTVLFPKCWIPRRFDTGRCFRDNRPRISVFRVLATRLPESGFGRQFRVGAPAQDRYKNYEVLELGKAA